MHDESDCNLVRSATKSRGNIMESYNAWRVVTLLQMKCTISRRQLMYSVVKSASVLCSSIKMLFVCVQVEPQLKYERMSNDLATILSRDAASCLAVHSKVT